MKQKSRLTILVLATLWASTECSRPSYLSRNVAVVGIFPFQNTSLPWSERVDDLVSRLTVDEIQPQMAKGGGNAPAIPRLGILPFDWTTECLHGDNGPGNATTFQQAIGLGATFSPELIYRVSTAISVEVRGKHNDFAKQSNFGSHTGSTCFSPVINIARDPRWGRVQETYGEDPILTGILAENFVKGLQGNHSRFVRATAGCKHFDVHGGPENIPVSRMSFDAELSDLDWRTTFLPAFKKCVEAGTFSLMCSYNRINGVPACANKKLLTDILRHEWGFKGYVVSDEGAIENIIKYHHYLNNSVDTAAACINAGTNLDLPPSEDNVFMSIVDAINQGKLTEGVVRERVKPLFYTRMRLGEFDPPEGNPYASLNNSVVQTPEHQALAVEAAVKSFVLLKNQKNILPLKPNNYRNVAVIGPMSDSVEQLYGDYSHKVDVGLTKTPLHAVQEIFGNVRSGKACDDGTPCKSYQSMVTRSVVTGADLVVVALGTGVAVESEGRDRPDVNLPGHQKDLLLDVINYNKNTSIILLLFSAGPLNVTIFDESDRVNAIMECFFPAQATGDALIAVLTNRGGNSSPAGRLPLTWPKFESQIPPMVNYSMEGRTYRYMESDPLYPFGYGLSYSNFHYEQLNVVFEEGPKGNISVDVKLQNIGNYSADEVIQCYIKWSNQSLPVPKIKLLNFTRVNIPAGSRYEHRFYSNWDNWAYWDGTQWTVQTGYIYLYCGGQQPFQAKSAPSNVLSANFPVDGYQSLTGHRLRELKNT